MKPSRLVRTLCTAIALIVASCGITSGASAQNNPGAPTGPRIDAPALNFKDKDSSVPFLAYLGLIVTLIVIVVANTIPTKRGHQD